MQEKISLIGGSGFGVRGVPRLGIPPLNMSDGPYGVRSGRSTVIPGGIGLAATWNVELARQEGAIVGSDAHARGSHFQLAPAVNIDRAPQAGRDFESFGEDPFLASQIAVGYIEGVQSQGVSATVKHFAANNSEYARNFTNSVIDERTLHEIYLPAFEAAVKQANVGAVMDSYNLLNGEYTSANRHLNVDILKKQWGFTGLLMSDWRSTHDPLGPAEAGLDLEMPSGASMNAQNILPAIAAGKLSGAVVDDKVRRLLRTEVRFGWLDHPRENPSLSVFNQHGREIALEGARESIVLLKNQNEILPLNIKDGVTMALIGPLAYPLVPVGGGSSQATPFHGVSLLEALSEQVGARGTILYDRGLPTYTSVVQATHFSVDVAGKQSGIRLQVFHNTELSGDPAETRVETHLSVGRGIDMAPQSGELPIFDATATSQDISYRWSGYYTPESPGAYHLVVFQSAGGEKTGYTIRVDGKLVKNDWRFPEAIVDDVPIELSAGPHKVLVEFWSKAGFPAPLFRVGIKRDGTWVDPKVVAMAAKANVAVLSVGFDPTTEFEGWDRTFHLPLGQEELIEKVTAVNPNTIVVLQGGGNIDMARWLDKVQAILHAWYPGQEGGTAVAEVLLGSTNPSGHLPVTFEQKREDNPTFGNYYPDAADMSPTPKVEYREGVFVGYRGYDRNKVHPTFPFGFGLSYTSFAFSHLQLERAAPDGDAIFQASVNVSNTGKRSGKVVVQMYVSPSKSQVPRPEKELRGFAKIELAAGETRNVVLPLTARAFSYYGVKSKTWIAPAGSYEIRIGESSEDVEVRGVVRILQALSSK